MAKIQISSLTVGALAVNCWLVTNEDTKETLVIDPGEEAERIKAYAEQKGFQIRYILLTHGHADHMGGVEALKALTKAPVCALRQEEAMLLDAGMNLSPEINYRPITVKADEFFEDGQKVTLCGITLEVLYTPGHTPGGCCFYCKEAGCVFSGDTLFQGSVGRSDFPGGSMSKLVRSVREKLLVLPEETVVYPGHGERTTIGYEKKYNPFL